MGDVDPADAELDVQAQVMAEKALEKLPPEVRATKIAKVKEGILKRLKDQAAKAAGGASAQTVVAPSGQAPPPPPEGAPPPPSEEADRKPLEKLEGIEACGDEEWFADLALRRALREGVVNAHKEQKILVSQPADEIRRIWPGGGRIVFPGAVLRLGGSHIGGYGDSDISYAYRQLSRALHPDKNPDVPEAQDAFKRLSEAAEELRQGLNDARNVLRMLLNAMGGTCTPEMLERPQEALMAESCRLLCALLAIAGEGEVPPTALSRAMSSFQSSTTFYNSQPQVLLTQFFDMSTLLDYYAGTPIRTAYDCSKKRFRAQFLTAMNRVAAVEAKRQSDCIRGNWQEVLMQFPEIHLWRELVQKLKDRVWSSEGATEADEAPKRSKWDEQDAPASKPSAWATKWRDLIKLVLPRGIDAATALTDPEVRKLTAALWEDVAAWARENDAERHLGLFTSEGANAATDQWAFVPQADLLLIVGDGMVGLTAEGVFADNRPGHEPCTYEEALKGGKEREPSRKRSRRSRSRSRSRDRNRSRDRDRDRDERKGAKENERDKEKREQQEGYEGFDWEKEWRNRNTKRRGGGRADSPPRRKRSRSRDRRPRSRSRRRSRSRGRRRGRALD